MHQQGSEAARLANMCVIATWNRLHALMVNLRSLNASLAEEFDSVLRSDLEITEADKDDESSADDQVSEDSVLYSGIDKAACKMFGINLEMIESAC